MRLQAPVATSRNAFLFAHFGLFSPFASVFYCGNLYFMISMQITHLLLLAPYRYKIDDFINLFQLERIRLLVLKKLNGLIKIRKIFAKMR